jgi:hypothetical protein
MPLLSVFANNTIFVFELLEGRQSHLEIASTVARWVRVMGHYWVHHWVPTMAPHWVPMTLTAQC